MTLPSFPSIAKPPATPWSFGPESLLIDQDKAVYWPAQQALLLADLHLGKATHFRQEGVYVPGNVLANELARLNNLIATWQPKQVFILGDLFHARHNDEWHQFAAWLSQYLHIRWVLVKGNHDVLPVSTYQEAGLEVVPHSLTIGDMVLSHKPEHLTLSVGQLGIAGHVHPGYSLGAKGMRGSVRLPCLLASPTIAILPAWGSFTGLDIVDPAAPAELFLFAPKQVFRHTLGQ